MQTGNIVLFMAITLWQSATSGPQQKSTVPAPQKQMESETATELMKVRRIFVESFGDDATSKQPHDMLITSLSESKRFIVTENKEKADAIFKGSGLEKTSQEYHAISEAAAAGGASGGHAGSIDGTASGGNASITGSSHGSFHSSSAAAAESHASTNTVNDARRAVRLVSLDGDVIWTASKESKGAKYKGSSADVADQIVKQLIWDLDKLQNKPK
jgi:curli biogenesis system outer membrane secretion channel CsgG